MAEYKLTRAKIAGDVILPHIGWHFAYSVNCTHLIQVTYKTDRGDLFYTETVAIEPGQLKAVYLVLVARLHAAIKTFNEESGL
jgi:hypothetical protein